VQKIANKKPLFFDFAPLHPSLGRPAKKINSRNFWLARAEGFL